jgi:4-diphosphocytidyl-2-C-methyl-D-erythritol kinase
VKNFKTKSFCKINLSLKVLNKVSNGLHSINSIITFCSVYDKISISKIEGNKDKIIFSGRFKKKINKKKNTVVQVLQLLRKKKYIKKQAFQIKIQKNIPHGSGLGGGSSNAATLINSLNLQMKLKIKKEEMLKIANQVGFDVPINLVKKNTLLIGKNNKILRINKKFRLIILIVYPNIICSTKKIYKKNKKYSSISNAIHFYKNKKIILIDYLKNQNNDLEKAAIALHPIIKKVLDFIKIQNGCHFSRITGSGSACIGIFSNIRTAIYTQKLIKTKFPKYWCVVSKTI